MVALRAYVLRAYLVRDSATMKALLARVELCLKDPSG
jgi:hypothetical protein